MTKTTSTRRAVLAGAVALPAIAVPRLAISAGTQPDPIFAAIERHKTTYITWTETGKIQSETKCLDEEKGTGRDMLKCRLGELERSMRAGLALTNIEPATHGWRVGAPASTSKEFNYGWFGHPSDSRLVLLACRVASCGWRPRCGPCSGLLMLATCVVRRKRWWCSY